MFDAMLCGYVTGKGRTGDGWLASPVGFVVLIREVLTFGVTEGNDAISKT
jgi:hypothetical protein